MMLRLNANISSITDSATLAITSRARELAAKGTKICNFGAGEPDFDTPQHIKEAARRALQAGQTKYCPAAGISALREAISEKLAADNRLLYAPEQVVVSNGAKHSLFNIFMAICSPGDEVIIPSPYWLSYPEMVKVAGARPVVVPCREANDFKMTPEEFEKAITPKTRALVFNSPSNPVGCVYSEAETRALCEVAVRRDLLIISDEIYEKLVYDGRPPVSPGSLSRATLEHTITVNGFSKAYSMPGWRLGYLAAPLGIAKVITAFQSHTASGPNTFAQFGAVEALRGPQKCVEDMRVAFAERCEYIHGRIAAMKGLTCVKPTGAFYVLPNISRFGMDSQTFSARLLEAEGVAVVPGLSFGVDGHIRLSYACGMENIVEGMDRLERFVGTLARA